MQILKTLIHKIVRITLLLALMMLGGKAGNHLHKKFMYEHKGNSVVKLLGLRSGGTGWQVTHKGENFIVTNRHICEIANSNKQLLAESQDNRTMLLKVVKMSDEHDLCIVEPFPGLRGLSIADNVSIKDSIYLVGHPNLRPLSIQAGEVIGFRTINLAMGYNLTDKQCSGVNVPAGPLAAMFGIKTICLKAFYSMQASVISYGGNSGSPVMNSFGNVVGVLFAGSRGIVNDAYIVPLFELKRFLDENIY